MTDNPQEPNEPENVEDETSAFDFPMHVASIDEVPEQDRDLYVRRGEGYALIPVYGMAIYSAKYGELKKWLATFEEYHDQHVALLERQVRVWEAYNKALEARLERLDGEEAVRQRLAATDKGPGIFAGMLSDVLN